MLIDFHVHLAGSGCNQSGIVLGSRFQKRPTFYFLKKSQKITADQMINDIDLLWIKRISNLVKESGTISKAVTLCFDAVYDEKGKIQLDLIQLYVPNEWGAEAVSQFPSTLLHGASIHPYRQDALQELEKAAKRGAFLIKWLPSAMGIDPESNLCLPFFEALKHYKIPLLSHTDREYTFAEPRKDWLKFNHIQKLKKALELGVVVIAAHGGTPSQMTEAHELAGKFENFFLDTSGLFNPSRVRSSLQLFKNAQENILSHRLLFATDWPVPAFPLFLIDKLGISSYKSISNIKNPFIKDLKIKELLGFTQEHFKKNQESLLTMLGRSHSEINLT
ncbi:amidohydrolase family protein [Silvanigrella aquatica]|uniref:Amidohydrolase-related domain-containing protein n=1 Tax=Silvanigrella aquatica TaxID=1915309 RepID=A0A1L4CXS2_9BACT|nr:amidohydrolase family protein [Silvanigrella aquatica]APJ02745.1 hypothetical protein AXG55_01910 [Silvanigrella aquatica]